MFLECTCIMHAWVYTSLFESTTETVKSKTVKTYTLLFS